MTPLVSTALLRTQSDARLASLARDGHELAFEAIVERYRRPLHGYCRRVLPDGRAEDVVQQAFLSAWTALQRGDDVRELRAWLYRIAHNTAINNLKRAGYDYDELRESLEHATTPEADLERRAVMRETLAGVASLPENQREALLRTAVEGASQAEIARDLGVTDGAVRQLVHRARATLRAAATAITPFPLAAWAANASSAGGQAVGERIGELAAGAGTAGVGGLLLKGGAAVVVAGAIAAPATVHHVRSDGRARAATTTKATPTGQAPVRVSAAVPVVKIGTGSETRSGTGSGKTRSRGRGERSSGRGKGGDRAQRQGGGDHGGSAPSFGEDHGGSRNQHDGRTRDDSRHSRSRDGSSGSGRDDQTDQRITTEDHSGSGGGDDATRHGGSGSGDEGSRSGSGGSGSGGPGSGGSGDGSSDSDARLPHD